MSFFEAWVETPLAEAVGWTLLHSLWEGAIISAVLGAVLVGMRSSRARYAAACMALLMMLGGSGFTLVQVMPERIHGMQTLRRSAFPEWKDRSSNDDQNSSNPSLAAVVPWLSPFWLAGFWIFSLKHLAAWISVCRMRRRGACCAPKHWQKELVRLSAQLRLSRPILLLESCLADAPLVIGHLRPLILMPVGLLAGLPAGQIEAILLHELAHIRRCDYLVNAVQRLVEGLFFYHPAVWWISRVIRAERENCCDDVVVAMSGNVHEYAVALVALEQNRWPGQPAVAATGGSLMKRIRRLLYPQGPSSAWTSLFAVFILSLTATVAWAAWPSELPQSSSSSARAQTGQAKTSDQYLKKWLDEDVVYIITDEEEAAFKRLTTNEERYRFIEQFWSRRDPSPDTIENEFRDEHYRRIAYANERFLTGSGKPGWQTDRGHMYIVYGPPDRIESHPSGGTNTPPFEVWQYNHIEGIGDDLYISFIDRMRTGDYHVAPGNPRSGNPR
ncbi:MAG TPA: GWxTD domain-containing protein [Terriglobia bacterium]|nr:GWxTD domain-containing protein [Terriglobia bacterium]